MTVIQYLFHLIEVLPLWSSHYHIISWCYIPNDRKISQIIDFSLVIKGFVPTEISFADKRINKKKEIYVISKQRLN